MIHDPADYEFGPVSHRPHCIHCDKAAATIETIEHAKGCKLYGYDIPACENCGESYDKSDSTALSRCDFCSVECERNWHLPPDATNPAEPTNGP